MSVQSKIKRITVPAYEESPEVAFRNAVRIIKETGCTAVKMEGGKRIAETIRYLNERGIPVMAHIGLTPQSIQTMGGFKTQGRVEEEWGAIEEDAAAIAEAGAFAVVLEGMAEPLAARITRQISIPTIGIGASAECDGQILVLEDMLGLSPKAPKFVKEFATLGAQIAGAAVRHEKSEIITGVCGSLPPLQVCHSEGLRLFYAACSSGRRRGRLSAHPRNPPLCP